MARFAPILGSLAVAAGLICLHVPLAGAASKPPPALVACAFGTDVPLLHGFLPSAVKRAADSYAAGLSSAGQRTRTAARQVFAAAAAAYVYGLPQVTLRATIQRFLRNQIVSVAALATPAVQTVVAPNNDTAYTVSWLDLAGGPIVVNVPDTGARFYTFQFLDAFTNAFAYLGTGSTGTKAGAYGLVPPGWRGSLPAGLRRIDSPSDTVWLLGRTLVRDAADLPAVKSLMTHYSATPLAAWSAGTRQVPLVLDTYPPLVHKPIPTGSEFIATLNNDMQLDPPPKADDCTLRALAPAGVQRPRPSSNGVPPANGATPVAAAAVGPGTDTAISAGTAAGARIVTNGMDLLNARSAGANNGWEILGSWVGRYGRDYIGRAIVTLDLLGANTPQQTIYPIANTDIQGRRLDGSKRYTIRFGKRDLPPVRAFWSLTMYNGSFFLYDNKIKRYSIGDRSRGLHLARDGSLTIYIQHSEPTDPANLANWLPAPLGKFHLMLRLYQPKPAAFDGTWKPPGVRP